MLALLQTFGGSLPNRDFQKFLMLHECALATERSFDFVPYRYGGFSFQSYADRRGLADAGLLADAEGWRLASDEDFFAQLKPQLQESVRALKATFGHLKGRALVREVYRLFPYYAIRSDIAASIMTQAELDEIRRAVPTDESLCLFTIGYEGISLDTYLNRLIQNNVKLLCDVRRNPLSRKYGFSKSTLRDAVERVGIRYVHIPDLGISSGERQTLETRADYDRLFARYERTTLSAATDALAEVTRLLSEHRRIALTCFEADVCMCHRGRIVKALAALPEPPTAIAHI